MKRESTSVEPLKLTFANVQWANSPKLITAPSSRSANATSEKTHGSFSGTRGRFASNAAVTDSSLGPDVPSAATARFWQALPLVRSRRALRWPGESAMSDSRRFAPADTRWLLTARALRLRAETHPTETAK